MPNRIIKESICFSEDINKLSAEEENFFYRLIVNCDDFGRFEARPAILKGRLYPLRDTIKESHVKSCLLALASLKPEPLVHIYHVKGIPYLEITTWKKHQFQRALKSRYPAPELADELISKQMNSDESVCSHTEGDASLFDIRYSSNDIRYSSNDIRDESRGQLQEIIDLYNQHRGKMPQAITLTSQREKLIKARLHENGMDKITWVIMQASTSSFLQGGNKTGWTADLTWIMRPENFAKIMEGNYENKAKTKLSAFAELLEEEDGKE